MVKYKFDCGCEFDVLDDRPKDCDGLPSIAIDYYNIPLDCPTTWELIQSGKTKGIFQLETNLGKHWSKELLPQKIEEMSALISLIRPGCLKSFFENKSMTQHYCDRKNKGDEIKYFHQALEPILKNNYGIFVYQEDAMKISRQIAGFSMDESETLRKTISKKKPEIMSKIKIQFIDGCKTTKIVNEDEAEQIFGWIQEGQRYLFCKAHGIGYSQLGYWTAYAKAHFPLHFYTSWLYYANEKMDPQAEMRQLISDAKYFEIEIKPPNLTKIFNGDAGHFSFDKDGIYFGIGDIKKIGQSHVDKILTNVKDVETLIGRKIDKWTWYDFLVFFSNSVSSTVVNGLIDAGATDYMGGSRASKVHEYNKWRELSAKEQEFIYGESLLGNLSNNLLNSILYMLEFKPKIITSRRKKLEDIVKNLKETPFSTLDDAYYIANREQELLGIPLTCTKLDTCHNTIEPNCTCKEFLSGKSGKLSLCVEITGSNEYIIKNGKSKGQKMLFLQIQDGTGSLDSVVVFPNALIGNEPFLINGSTVTLEGQRDKKKTESFIVENIIPI